MGAQFLRKGAYMEQTVKRVAQWEPFTFRAKVGKLPICLGAVSEHVIDLRHGLVGLVVKYSQLDGTLGGTI